MARNDPPTSLRMGFGYRQARAARLDGIRSDRSPRQINDYINARKTERKAIRWLTEEVQADPEWECFVKHWIEEGCSAKRTMDGLWRTATHKWRGASFQFLRRYLP